MKKLWLLILIVNAGLGLIIFLLYKQISLEKQNQASLVQQDSQYPYFPAKSEAYLDQEKTWLIKSFQPVFKEMIEVESKRYLVVSYAEGEAKIFVGSQIPYKDEAGQKQIIDSLSLKEKLKPGDQFGINYLAGYPADFSLQLPRCQNQAVECILAAFKKQSDAKGENIFYPLLIYRILKP
ncbi:MAG: hypothetical protein V1810_02505 [Candidatus Beckwithbacteria bacterium]